MSNRSYITITNIVIFVIFSVNQGNQVKEPNFVSITFVMVNEEKGLTSFINNQLEFVMRELSVYILFIDGTFLFF